ncbi:MAG: type II secretion system minor pseudopilin GspH [Pseudomonadota bacterium]
MQTAGCNQNAGGFTLIEVLVVITLISIIMATIVGSFSGADRTQQMQGYVERMAQRIEMARDRAIQTNHEWGIYVEDETVEFAEFDPVNGEWMPIQKRPFNPDQSDSELRFRAKVEAYAGQIDSDEDELPAIVLFSSGETSPFQILVEFTDFQDAEPWVLFSDGFQRTDIRRGRFD